MSRRSSSKHYSANFFFSRSSSSISITAALLARSPACSVTGLLPRGRAEGCYTSRWSKRLAKVLPERSKSEVRSVSQQVEVGLSGTPAAFAVVLRPIRLPFTSEHHMHKSYASPSCECRELSLSSGVGNVVEGLAYPASSLVVAFQAAIMEESPGCRVLYLPGHSMVENPQLFSTGGAPPDSVPRNAKTALPSSIRLVRA